MKCLSCDVILSDFEATRRYADSKEFVELCNHCFKTISDQINCIERYDLLSNDTLEEAYEDDYRYKDYE